MRSRRSCFRGRTSGERAACCRCEPSATRSRRGRSPPPCGTAADSQKSSTRSPTGCRSGERSCGWHRERLGSPRARDRRRDRRHHRTPVVGRPYACLSGGDRRGGVPRLVRAPRPRAQAPRAGNDVRDLVGCRHRCDRRDRTARVQRRDLGHDGGRDRARGRRCGRDPSGRGRAAMSVAEGSGRTRTIQSVDRAAALLKTIADSNQPPTVVELAAACGLNRTTAWRLLATLDAHGLVERDPVSQRYSLGYAFLRMAAGADLDPLVRRARPVLERLARDTGEATNLAVAKRFSLVYVDQVDPPQIMAPNWFGRAVPLHATSTGKAYLAFLPPEERRAALPERLERYTKTTITSRKQLEDELAEVRRDGYATCVGELEESLFGASSPVLSEQGRPVAIVSVWGTEHRLPREKLPEIGRRTQAAADEVRSLLQ